MLQSHISPLVLNPERLPSTRVAKYSKHSVLCCGRPGELVKEGSVTEDGLELDWLF